MKMTGRIHNRNEMKTAPPSRAAMINVDYQRIRKLGLRSESLSGHKYFWRHGVQRQREIIARR